MKDECVHRKGKMIAFDEDSFVGTFNCRVCGQPFTQKAAIVCTEGGEPEVPDILDRVTDIVLKYRPKDKKKKPRKRKKYEKQKKTVIKKPKPISDTYTKATELFASLTDEQRRELCTSYGLCDTAS